MPKRRLYQAGSDSSCQATVAIGKTLADGVYTCRTIASADFHEVCRLLDEAVPAVLSVFKETVKLLF